MRAAFPRTMRSWSFRVRPVALAWMIASGRYEKANQAGLLKEIRHKIQREFGILHLTIQMETPEFEQEDEVICFDELKVKSKTA